VPACLVFECQLIVAEFCGKMSILRRDVMINVNSKPMTFVILEDDIDMVNAFADLAEIRNDIKLIAHTNSSFEAIKLVKKLKPEAVIVDLELPNGNGTGFEFLTELRNTVLNFMLLVIVNTKVQPGMVYDGIHEGYADLVYYKGQDDYKIEYIINSMLFSRKKSNSKVKPNTALQGKLQDEEIKKLTNLINKELDNIGIKRTLNGSKYLIEAILFMLEKNPKTVREVSPLIHLSNIYNMYPSNISRDISTAISNAWLNTPIDDLAHYYTGAIKQATCQPTPMELIYYYYLTIKEKI